jgi:RNA polymerase sigma-70 factor (ECF subfamily)
VSPAQFDALASGPDFADDQVLARALAARDPDAFGYLLDRYHGPLMRLARQYVSTGAVAEEVVQQTWLAVMQSIDRFEGRASVKTWLFRILVNTARANGVKEHRSIPFSSVAPVDDREPAVEPSRFRRFRHSGQWKQPPDPWPGPEEQALDAEVLAVVSAAIDQLPAAQREVVTLRDVMGWTAPEACAALEVSAGNERVLLHRGRSKVRAAVERYYDDQGDP